MQESISRRPWEEPAKGVRFKAITRDGKRLRLVEFTSEFNEHEWRLKGHIGYVLDGELEIMFEHRTEKFSAGDGVFILGGDKEKHKAHIIGRAVRLILVEDAAV